MDGIRPNQPASSIAESMDEKKEDKGSSEGRGNNVDMNLAMFLKKAYRGRDQRSEEVKSKSSLTNDFGIMKIQRAYSTI